MDNDNNGIYYSNFLPVWSTVNAKGQYPNTDRVAVISCDQMIEMNT